MYVKKQKQKQTTKFMGVRYFFSRPELAFALCHVIGTLGYLKLQDNFITP